MIDKYALLIDTLNLFLYPSKQLNVPYSETIELQLQELEGDCYTFMHSDNIIDLVEQGEIPLLIKIEIEEIRNMVSKLDNNLWSPNDFIHNIKWAEIRNKVISVL